MSKKEIFNNAVTNIDDAYIAEAMNTENRTKKILFTSVIAVLMTLFILFSLYTGMHYRYTDNNTSKTNVEILQNLKEKEKEIKRNSGMLDKACSLPDYLPKNYIDEVKKEMQIAIDSMKNPKEVVFEDSISKQYKQVEKISLRELDLSKVDTIEILSLQSLKQSTITDKKDIEKICNIIKNVSSDTLADQGEDYMEYRILMISNGETVFGFYHETDGKFMCTDYLFNSLVYGTNVSYTIYHYSNNITKNSVMSIFRDL